MHMLSFKTLKDLLDEDYKTTASKFISSGVDKPQVDVYIDKFKALSNKQKLSGDEKNIDTWAKKVFSEFSDFVYAKEDELAVVAKKKAEKIAQKKDQGHSIDITTPEQRSAGWNIIIPLDKEASCYHGTGTDWCVSKREHDYFNEYFHDNNVNLIFCLNDKKEKWAIAIPTDGDIVEFHYNVKFFDEKDNNILQYDFEKQTGLKFFADIVDNYKHIYISQYLEKIRESSPNALFRKFTNRSRFENTITADEYKQDIASHKIVQDYLLKHPWNPDLRIANILKYELVLPAGIPFMGGIDYMFSHIDRFIIYVLDDTILSAKVIRFIKPYILSTKYKKAVESELVKSDDITLIMKYIEDISEEPFPEAEPIIAQYGSAAFYYATEILKARFPAGEREINRTSYYSNGYADMIKSLEKFPITIKR